MAMAEAKPALATTVFSLGNFPFTSKKVETSNRGSPPKPVLIVTPTTSGQYPVILFLHGFFLRNGFYSQLLEHISSHGFIVVAPQLPENVQANLLKLALAGHSRGGQAAFALALGYANTSLKFSVLLGIDPVAGNEFAKLEPYILTNVPRSFNISIPVTVIGTGLGPKKELLKPFPSAPEGFNHVQYFNECKPPCAHFVTKDYGHLDMLNDKLSDFADLMRNLFCVNGEGPRDPMRKSVGGIVVAILKAYTLEGERGDLEAILGDPDLVPVKIEPLPELIEA
ncbi:chlorophyllase-1 [Quercus suber]|uniref:Chlorophyllase-1 n=1 Tax=Quercus suber TaxID=58331 RepID=A0AAW0L4V2_QUESU